MNNNKEVYKIILDQKIYEPTGKIQENGREVIYTRKTVAKYGKLTITTKSNEPSKKAIEDFNRLFNLKVDEIIHKQFVNDNLK